MEIKAVRGMHDLFGVQLEQWFHWEQKIRQIFSNFGYSEIRTPVLEKLDVFSKTVGDDTDIVEKQMYTVLGDDSEKLVLRPEGTAAFMRALIEHQLHRTGIPQRFFYYLPMFRHERPQKGRLRQFHQFGGELIHDPSAEADAEIIALMDAIFRGVGIEEYEVRINSVGDQECRPKYKEVLKKYLQPHLGSLCEQCQKRFERSPLRILDCKKESCATIVKKAPSILNSLCEGCRTHQANLVKSLKRLEIAFIEDPGIVRGLDYYNRTAFEFTSQLLGAQSALGGGGRYDGLASRFGEKPFPSVGFALGMERVVLALEEKKNLPQITKAPTYYFAALGEAAFDMLYPLSISLKKEGVWVEMAYDKEKGLKGLLKNADRSGATYSVILGDNEMQNRRAVLKNMKAGSQEEISLDHLRKELLRRMNLAT